MLKDLLMYLEIAVAEEVDNPSTDVNPQEGEASVDTQTNDVDEQEETQEETTNQEAPLEFDIDGEKLTLEQIREFKRGYMRQSDYTRKTQELASKRQELNDAVELYEYLKANPEIAAKLAEIAPEDKQELASKVNPLYQKVEELSVQLRLNMLEKELEHVLSTDKYGVTEMELLEIAQQEKCSIDKAYKLWKADNADKILEKQIAESKKKITEEIQKNYGVTKTLIKSNDNPAVKTTNLTEIEKIYAAKLGMSEEEYAKWKQ